MIPQLTFVFRLNQIVEALLLPSGKTFPRDERRDQPRSWTLPPATDLPWTLWLPLDSDLPWPLTYLSATVPGRSRTSPPLRATSRRHRHRSRPRSRSGCSPPLLRERGNGKTKKERKFKDKLNGKMERLEPSAFC